MWRANHPGDLVVRLQIELPESDVVPAVELGRLHCPCHNGWFDLQTGRPVAGPPQRALPRVHVEIRGGTVYATAVEDPAS